MLKEQGVKELLTTEEMASYLKLRPETVIRKAKRGELPAIKIGRQFRFDKNQTDRWLLQNLVGRVLHVLVVDDEPMIGKLFEETLREIGVGVTATSSSVEAVGLVSGELFDLAFIDLKMPVMDGNELFKRIREIDERLPVVIITGYSESELLDKVIQQGPFIVLKKPFESDDILNIVGTILHDAVTKRMPREY
ncbi:MAG TPA: response regulator [Dehalococcoidia bacterium]|nr:response regulator [Dehalococcoidia bacterium]